MAVLLLRASSITNSTMSYVACYVAGVKPVTLVFLLSFSISCGSSTPRETVAPELSAPESQKVSAECNDMCKRITACAIADARANMSNEEFAKLEIEKTAPRHTWQCIVPCEKAKFGEEKKRLAADCTANQSLSCEQFGECLAPLDGPSK